ncbi:MAG: efflux RND transporter periplasmic adaptor subunit [Deltaproteobacteria bacterium]|nr:efflux RND transporter periplasmic adaptor subunit [Deltaproteobacteria bacterium]
MNDDPRPQQAVAGAPEASPSGPGGSPGPEEGRTATSAAPDGPRTPSRRVVLLRFAVQLLLAAAVVYAGIHFAQELIRTKPKVGRRTPPRTALLVEVVEVERSSERVVLDAQGTVGPSRELELHARVAGEVVEVAAELVPGGLLRAGDVALRIDPVDYELKARQVETTVAQARAALRIEQGSETVARREFELFGQDLPTDDLDLVLREPQLAKARAAVAAARAQLAAAQLDLERTTVPVPFDAVVRTRGAVLGTRVTEATALALLAATDEWWIEALVPVDELRWLRIPQRAGEEGSPARVRDEAAWGPGAAREARVVRLAPGLEPQGRLARVVVAVSDPLALDPANAGLPPLILGSWVELEIQGPELESVAVLDRGWLRDGDRVWVMGDDRRLEIRSVTLAFKERDRVLVRDGLEPGDRVVVSEIAAPVQGMQLRLRDDPVEEGERPRGRAAGEHPPGGTGRDGRDGGGRP